MIHPKLIDKLLKRLPSAGQTLLSELFALTNREGIAGYLVGGPVRDLLLNRPSLDLDIVVEGDAIALARRLAGTTGARLRTHPAFLTASLRLYSFVLDLTTARAETYARPGALPTVTPASIREDLLRRDFTINAMALPLSATRNEKVLDPTGGQDDLRDGLIRALHTSSFQDDATRISRASRYASRFGFAIESQTLSWLKRDLPYINSISAARLHHEFTHIFDEDEPEKILLDLHEHDVLAAIHPALRFEPAQVKAFDRLRRLNPKAVPAAYWPILAWGLPSPDISSIARLALTNPQRAALEAMPALAALVPDLRRRSPKRSTLVEMLSPFPFSAVWAFAALAAGHTVREHLMDYLTKARFVRPLLRGDDLIALGVPPGPQVGEILRRLRDAKLDAEVNSREDEERLVAKLVPAAASALPLRPDTPKHAPSRSS